MPNNRNLRDASLIQTLALPASTTAVASAGFALPTSSTGDYVAESEFHVIAPALTTSQLPDAKTMTYTVETDTDPAYGTATVLETLGAQTGAGGAGAASKDFRFRVPTNVKPYVRIKATPSASGTGDASAALATFEILH